MWHLHNLVKNLLEAEQINNPVRARSKPHFNTGHNLKTLVVYKVRLNLTILLIQSLGILPDQFFNRVEHPSSLVNVIKLLPQALHPLQVLLLLDCSLSLGHIVRK